MKIFKYKVFLLLVAVALGCGKSGTVTNPPAGGGTTPPITTTTGFFTNPLLTTGPDPWVTQSNGYYYFTKTSGNLINVYKTA